MPSRLGPRPCTSKRWQVAHPSDANNSLPVSCNGAVAPPAIHCAYSCGSMTTMSPPMPECWVPQYSAQNIMIVAGHGGLKPERGVAPGQYVLLDAEGGDKEAVNHV